MSDWRGSENEYAVLVAPYFQYPQTRSQIYSKALTHNVCLLSWEHISLLLEHGIKETATFTLESLWNASQMMARDKNLSFANAQICFLPRMDSFIAKKIGIKEKDYQNELDRYKTFIVCRGKMEISYWENHIQEIRSYTREQAIDELISARKLTEKIAVIRSYLARLNEQE